MIEYEESLRTLMDLFGEDIESGMSYEHIHKVIYDNLDNLKELINKQKEEKKVINKYQEAKRYIDMIWSEPSWSRVDINWLAIEQIKELLDKETPMKPIIKSGGIDRCGKCKYQYDPDNDYYCSQCGQCRDWSDEE